MYASVGVSSIKLVGILLAELTFGVWVVVNTPAYYSATIP